MRLHLTKPLAHSITFLALASVLSGAGAQVLADSCSSFGINRVVSTAGYAGYAEVSPVVPGQVFTFTMTPGTATSASWRIVGQYVEEPPLPSDTVVGGGTVSSTLTYTPSPGAPFPTVWVDAIDGTATITGSCRERGAAGGAVSVPTVSEWGLLLMGMALAVATAFRLRRRN